MCENCYPNNTTQERENNTMSNTYNPETIREEFAKFAQDLANAPAEKTPRTWGFEIESNTMDRVKSEVMSNTRLESFALKAFLEFQSDGSVENYISDGCECDCGDCEHSCDCDNCGFDSDYLDHCGDCGDCEEVASVGGIDTTHPLALTLLEDGGINDATYEEDCGIHVHIFSGDLTAPQVANVLTAYRLAEPIMTAIAERYNTGYASAHTPELEDNVRRGLKPDTKMMACNVLHHFQTYRPQTIEIRQMSAQSHTEIPQSFRVRAWAMLQLQLIEFAIKPAPQLYWINRAKTLTDLLRLLRA
jgi:hypothetical protein